MLCCLPQGKCHQTYHQLGQTWATMVPVPRRNLYSTKSSGLLWTLRRNIVFVRREGGRRHGRAGGQGEKVRIPQLRKEGGKDRVHVEECLCLSAGL